MDGRRRPPPDDRDPLRDAAARGGAAERGDRDRDRDRDRGDYRDRDRDYGVGGGARGAGGTPATDPRYARRDPSRGAALPTGGDPAAQSSTARTRGGEPPPRERDYRDRDRDRERGGDRERDQDRAPAADRAAAYDRSRMGGLDDRRQQRGADRPAGSERDRERERDRDRVAPSERDRDPRMRERPADGRVDPRDRDQNRDRDRDRAGDADKDKGKDINNLLAQIDNFDLGEEDGTAAVDLSGNPTPRILPRGASRKNMVAPRNLAGLNGAERERRPSPADSERPRRPAGDESAAERPRKPMTDDSTADLQRKPAANDSTIERGATGTRGELGSRPRDANGSSERPSPSSASNTSATRSVTTGSNRDRYGGGARAGGDVGSTSDDPLPPPAKDLPQSSPPLRGVASPPPTTIGSRSRRGSDSRESDSDGTEQGNLPRGPSRTRLAARNGPSTVNDTSSDAGRSGTSGRTRVEADTAGRSMSSRRPGGTIERSRSRGPNGDNSSSAPTGDDLPTREKKRRNSNGSSTSYFEPLEPSAIRSMVPDAVGEAKNFVIYPAERFDEKRKELAVLSSQVSSLQNRLTLESRIREAALALTRSQASGNADKAQQRTAQEQLTTANRKVDAIATDLWKVTGKLMEVERLVLKHTAGVLRWGVMNKVDAAGSTVGQSPVAGNGLLSPSNAGLEDKLRSAENKIRENEREQRVLKASIARLESESEPLRRELENLKRDKEDQARALRNAERKARDLEDEMRSAINNNSSSARGASSPGSVPAAEHNKVKLELATTRADLAASQEESAITRERLIRLQKQMDSDLASMDGKDRIISDLRAELEEATNKLEMRDAKGAFEGSSGGSYPRKGGDNTGGSSTFSDEDVRVLKRLWAEMPPFTDRPSGTASPPVSPGRSGKDRDDPARFSAEEFVNKVSKALRERRDYQRRLEAAESNNRSAMEDSAAANKEITILAKSERELRAEVRSLQRSNERLEGELASALRQVKDVESMHSSNSGSSARKLDEIQAGYSREIQKLTDRHERKLRDLEMDFDKEFEAKAKEKEREAQLSRDRELREAERRLRTEFEVRLEELENQLEKEIAASKEFKEALESARVDRGKLQQERDELRSKLSDMESAFRGQAAEIESKQRNEINSLKDSHQRELKESLSRLQRDRDDLEDELSSMRRKLDDAKRSVDSQIKLQVEAAEDKAAADLRRRLDASEQIFREQLLEVQTAHDEEKEQMQLSHAEDRDRLRDQMNRDKQRELSDLRQQLESARKDIEAELSQRLDQETDNLRSKHSAGIDQLQSRHKEEIERIQDEHRETVDQLKSRLGRSEAALVSSKSQFFQDREKLQEQMDSLEQQVRTFKQQELEFASQISSKNREYESTIERLKYEVQSAQTQAEHMRDETDRKQREIAVLEQKHRQQLAAMQAECDARVKELESHIEEFEAVRGELESVERDYMAELSKHDTERIQAERVLAEAKESQNTLRQQIDALQRKLDQAHREVQEARSTTAPRVTDRATEKALQNEIERIQAQVVELKTTKNELLVELDDQGLRLQTSQNDLSAMRRDYDRLKRSIGDWDAERRRCDTTMSNQREEIASLQTRIQDMSLDRLGGGASSNEPPSTQKLRSEFRKMVADLRQEYSAQVSKEVTMRSQLESQLRQAQRIRDDDIYNRSNSGTQTNLKWITGDQPLRLHYT